MRTNLLIRALGIHTASRSSISRPHKSIHWCEMFPLLFPLVFSSSDRERSMTHLAHKTGVTMRVLWVEGAERGTD